MKTIKELIQETNDYITLHRHNGGHSEFDMSINEISREMVLAYKNEFGEAYVGKINLYGEARNQPNVLIEYTDQLIHNFEYEFVVPVKDSKLEELLNDYRTHRGSVGLMDKIVTITNRIDEINGMFLIWA